MLENLKMLQTTLCFDTDITELKKKCYRVHFGYLRNAFSLYIKEYAEHSNSDLIQFFLRWIEITGTDIL